MPESQSLTHLQRFDIPGRLHFAPGGGGLPKALLSTPWSECEVYLHGGQVTHFQKHGEAPLLFLSQASRFAEGAAIRGGIPICFPWFGSRPGAPAHGYARLREWQVVEGRMRPDGQVALRLILPEKAEPEASEVALEWMVTAGQSLQLELTASNRSPNQAVTFEECLHTYLNVGDVKRLEIEGLESTLYHDHMQNDQTFLSPPGPLRIGSQTDRTFPSHPGKVAIRDSLLGRVILVQKQGSASTVVWNPWTTQVLADLEAEEYRRFVCVESGNIGVNRMTLQPGASFVLQVQLETSALVLPFKPV